MYKRKTLLVLLIGLIFIMSSCKSNRKEIIDDNKNDKGPVEDIDEIEELINNMTIDEKIGQLMIIGFDGAVMDEHIKNMIEKNHVGGFILFKENILNIDQTVELINTLKKANNSNPIPLFLSIDEEGGKVYRLPNSFLKLPEAKRIGDINEKETSLEYGKILAMRIKSLGFNMDFAPVLDINSNSKNPVIGNRAFGSTVEVVVDNGIQVMKGIGSEGIISIIKHFPGHGDTVTDSHIDIPIVNKGLKELETLELIPFTEGIIEGADGIMVGHILFPELDRDNPATLSEEIIKNILREKIGYDGVVISDDMTMGAIMKNYNIEDASIQFLKAGGDIILICHGYENQLKVINSIKEEIKNGNISKEELDEKVYRIIKLKRKYNIEDSLVDEVNIEIINARTKKLLNKLKGL